MISSCSPQVSDLFSMLSSSSSLAPHWPRAVCSPFQNGPLSFVVPCLALFLLHPNYYVGIACSLPLIYATRGQKGHFYEGLGSHLTDIWEAASKYLLNEQVIDS